MDKLTLILLYVVMAIIGIMVLISLTNASYQFIKDKFNKLKGMIK